MKNNQARLLKLFAVLIVVVLILVARFWRLSEIPTAFVHDELIYLIQARAFAFTGSNIAGTWNPASLVPFNLAFAELPSVFLSFTVPLFSDPMLAGRVLHSIMGICIAVFLGLLTQGIWKNRQLSLTVILIALLNPWLWQYSRMPFDPLFSLFFYLSAGAVLFHFRSWWRLLVIPLLFLGFFQYQGHKLSFLPYVFGLLAVFVVLDSPVIRKWRIQTVHKQTLWIAGVVLISCISLFSYYVLYSLPRQQASVRLSQIRTPSSDVVQSAVNMDRRLTLESPIDSVLTNKYSETVRGITESFLKVTNLSFLFFEADEPANSFNVAKHGYFYLIDLPLLLLGLYTLVRARKDRVMNGVYLVLVMACTLPNLLSFGQSYSFRSSLFFLLLLPIIAHGINLVINQKNRVMTILLAGLYAISVISFIYQYNVQYPVYAADANLFSERVLSSYMSRIPKDQTIFVVVPDEEFVLHSYLYYNSAYTRDTAEAARQAVIDKSYIFQNIHIVTECDAVPADSDAVVITARLMDYCPDMAIASPAARLVPNAERVISVPAVVDSGELFRIYRDPVCTPYQLGRYIMPKKLDVFNVEQLSNEQFCTNWFSNVHD